MIALIPANKSITTNKNTKKAAIVNALQYEAARRRLNRFGLRWLILYCACAQTVMSQLPIKILTSPLDLATLIS